MWRDCALPEASDVPDLPFVIVAERAGKIVDFATVPERAGPSRRFVAPHAWRTGSGSLLVAEAGRLAAARWARPMHAVANERASAFYERCNLEPIGTINTDFEPAPEMRKSLLPFFGPVLDSPPVRP